MQTPRLAVVTQLTGKQEKHEDEDGGPVPDIRRHPFGITYNCEQRVCSANGFL